MMYSKATAVNCAARPQAGFTLLEVLISVLVLMIGILGVAAMQLTSFQANQGAYYRSQATYIAAEMLDRIRANPEGYNFYGALDTEVPATIPGDPACAELIQGCTPLGSAAMDLRQWSAHFVDVFDDTDYRPTIPASSAVITRAGGTNRFTVTVTWSEKSWDNVDNADGSGNRSNVDQSVSLTATLK